MIETSNEIEKMKMELNEEEGSTTEEEEVDSIVEIARALAGNTLKLRNFAFKRLESFLLDTVGFMLDHETSLKVWKGLFFMLWHSDGFLAQEQLCNRIGRLMGKFANIKNRMNFFQGAICIVNREWMGIDRLRMDKYMLVLRTLFRVSLNSLAENKWNMAHVDWFIGVLGCSPLQHQSPMGKDGPSPLGIRYHFADMWTEELLKAGGSNADCPLTPEQSLPFVKCWIKIAAMTNIVLLRKRITEKVFDDLIERSPASLALIASTNPDSPLLADLTEQGALDIDFQAVYESTVEMANGDDIKAKQRKAMYAIAKRFKSVASGEVPLDDIEEFHTNDDDVDKFLYQSEHSFSKKELAKMKGLKTAATLNDRFVNKLAAFCGEDNDDEVLDGRLAPKLKKKRKGKQQKFRERAERRRKLMNEVLDEETNNNDAKKVVQQQIEQVEEETVTKKSKKKKKKLDILSTDALLDNQKPSINSSQQDDEEIVVPLRKKAKMESSTTLAELADKIRNDIDQGREEEVDASLEPNPKKKKKQLKGETFDFIKVNPTPTPPTASAFMTRAQRKNKRGKVDKNNQKANLNRATMKAMMEKETTLKFDTELVKIKPFKKLDKPEVVGSHQGKLKVHDPEKTPTKSALKVKTTPKRVGKVKWQG